MSKNFYSLLNRPATIASCPGKKIYEWEYLDETGKVKKAKENTYEKIQSYKDSVDYKKLLDRGELEINDNYGVFMDTTKLGNNFADLNEFVNDVAEHVQQLKEQKSAIDARPTSSVEKATNVAEISNQSVQTQGESGQINQQSNGGNE